LTKAEWLIAEACRSDAVSEELLRRWRKGHPFKVKLALKLRAQTTVTIGWIDECLRMGTPATDTQPEGLMPRRRREPNRVLAESPVNRKII
jgi:hypothetical protein